MGETTIKRRKRAYKGKQNALTAIEGNMVDNTYKIRFAGDELACVRAKSDADNVTRSVVIRRLIREKMKEEGFVSSDS